MKFKKYFSIFIISFIITFIYGFFFYAISCDEIWNYGFAYNINIGLIMYRDFNMVITPLYPLLASLFINLFGNYLYSMYIFNSIICAAIVCLMYKKIKFKSFIIFPILLNFIQLGYNLFSLFLTVLILCSCDSNNKYKDIMLGLLVSFIFLTKQNIGFVYLVPLIFYSKNFKAFLKRIISFLIPILFLIIYLYKNDALYDFIDYCFLGLFDFGKSNLIWYLLPLWIPCIVYLLYKLFKSKFCDEECFYVLCFQFITYPLFDLNHFVISFSLFLYYLFKRINLIKIKQVLYLGLSIYCLFFLTISTFTEFLYEADNKSFLYGRIIEPYVDDGISSIEEYISSNSGLYDNDYNNLYIFVDIAYLIKLDMDIQINKYDLINNGNMGYKGEYKIINELEDRCTTNKCMFVLSSTDVGNQLNEDILNYVKDNYTKIDSVNIFDIYGVI
jgi:hypothetical protein